MRLNRQIAAKPTAGAVVLTFPETPLDRVWTGTITVPESPASALWTLSVGGQIWQSLLGTGPFGPVQAYPGEQIVLVGSGAGTAQLTALLLGTDDAYPGPSYEGPTALPSPSAPTAVSITGQPIAVDVDGAGQTTPVQVDIVAGITSPLPVAIDGLTTPNPLPVAVDAPVDGSGNVTVNPNIVVASIKYGQVTISSHPTQFPNHVLTQGCTFEALAGNAGKVYVGDGGVTTSDGWELSPGQAGPVLPVGNSDVLYVDGTVGDVVAFMGV